MLKLLNTALTEETIKVISSKDDCIKSQENYAKYLETLDESLLSLEGEPTRFVLKLASDAKTALKGKNAMYAAARKAQDNDGEIPMADLMLSTVKASMLGIDGEKITPLTETNWAAIIQHDILPELFTAIENRKKAATEAVEEAKKS